MLKMIDECAKVGLPEPEFNFDFNGLMVRFKGKPTEVAGKVAVKVAVKMAEKRSEEILALIKANPEITIPELASIIGASIRSIERKIQELQRENLLKRIGATTGSRWEIASVKTSV